MAGLFNDFKEHAQALHKDIKTLEKTFKNPLGFFQSTSRSATANIILKNELQIITNINGNVEEQIQELDGSISDNIQLFKQVEDASEDLNEITKLLEECGFAFSVQNDSPDSKEENEGKDAVNENEDNVEIHKHLEEPAESHVEDYLFDNELIKEEKAEDRTEKILELNEKYLEAHNIDLDDIVTPYNPRKSLFSGKKS